MRNKIALFLICFVFFQAGALFAGLVDGDQIIEELQSKVSDQLLQTHPFLSTSDIKIRVKNPIVMQTIPAYAHSYHIDFNYEADFLGFSIVPVNFFDEDQEDVGRIKIAIEAEGFSNFLFTKRVLRKRDGFEKRDFLVRYVSIRGKPMDAVHNYEEIRGLELKGTLGKGAVISRHLMQDKSLIRKGTRVNVVFENGPINLKVKGRALSAGKKGDRIRVQTSLSSGKVFEGEIIDSQTVHSSLIY